MSLFSTKSQAKTTQKVDSMKDNIKDTGDNIKDETIGLDDILDEIDAANEALKVQTKFIQEMMLELKALRENQQRLEIKIFESIRKDEELHDVKTRLFNMIAWMQEQFVCMLAHTKEKAAEPKISPTVKAYLDKKTDGKLPLPG